MWAVPQSGETVFAISKLDETAIQRLVRKLRRSLDPDAETLGDIPDFPIDTAPQIYRELLAPVASGWKGSKTVLVVTNSALGQVPLSLLVTKEVSNLEQDQILFSEYAVVPWLAKTHAITSLPSATALLTLRALPKGKANRRAFVEFGDPWFSVDQQDHQFEFESSVSIECNPTTSAVAKQLKMRRRNSPLTRKLRQADLSMLPRLPDTAAEVTEIGRETDIFLGKEASETRVKTMVLHDRRVLVFATHGLVPGDIDGLSFPALAFSSPQVTGDTSEDGLLTMDEILALRLDADWVVLSACNTAAGDGTGSEAVSGLGRAFFYAGSRALLVSNWPVETNSAKALTTDMFRRQALDPTLTRAQAFNTAILALLEGPGFRDKAGRELFSYAHPIFWAPFSLVGDGG